MLAGAVRTRLSGDLAVLPRVARRTLTHEIVVAGVQAGAAVPAGRGGARVVDNLTVGAGEARRTLARVGARRRVEAGSAVLAGAVIGAVVEVLVTEEASPTLVTVTLPRLLTSAVQAARVLLTLVTVGALPPDVTPAGTQTHALLEHTYTPTSLIVGKASRKGVRRGITAKVKTDTV